MSVLGQFVSIGGRGGLHGGKSDEYGYGCVIARDFFVVVLERMEYEKHHYSIQRYQNEKGAYLRWQA